MRKKDGRVKGPILGWHFIAPSDSGLLHLGYGDGREVTVGRWMRMKEKYLPVLCRRGMHASRKILHALSYKQGALCRVKVRGMVQENDSPDTGKMVGQERLVLHVIPQPVITAMLHDLAVRMAKASVARDKSLFARDTKRVLRWLASKRKMRVRLEAQFEKRVTAYVEKEMEKAKALRSAGRTQPVKRRKPRVAAAS